MTQEEKQLLMKDLYARQLYGVKVSLGLDRFSDYIEPETDNVLTLYYINPQRLECNFKECWWTSYIGAIKPYLRPLSSMTEEERDEFRNVGGVMSHNSKNDTWAICAFTPEAYDWLNEHHFDYRGLIEKGLAIEAPKDMYKNMYKNIDV